MTKWNIIIITLCIALTWCNPGRSGGTGRTGGSISVGPDAKMSVVYGYNDTKMIFIIFHCCPVVGVLF